MPSGTVQLTGLVAPIADFATARINNTLHGRSVYHHANWSGHNVFKGWETWKYNGNVGVGAALDIFGAGWREPVVAVCDGVQTVWRNDTSKLEVIYIEAPGVVAVYAHINARYEGTGVRVKQGETLGVVRGDLHWPHLHFELWLGGTSVSAPTPEGLRAAMLAEFGDAPPVDTSLAVVVDGEKVPCHPVLEDGTTRCDLRPLVESMGWSATDRKHDDGRKRIYVNPPESEGGD